MYVWLMCFGVMKWKLSPCRQWAAVAKNWRADLSIGGRAVIPKKYVQHLLAYENFVSQGAPEKEIHKAQQPKAPKTSSITKITQASFQARDCLAKKLC